MGLGLAATAFGVGIAALVLGWVPVFGPIFIALALGLGTAAVGNCRTKASGRSLAVKGFVMSSIAFSMFVIVRVALGQ
jgi:hypothetical protein